MNISYILGFVLTAGIIVITLLKKDKKLHDYLLSLLILLIGCNLLVIYSMTTSEYKIYSSIILIDIFYWILLGPTIFLLTKAVISKELKLSWKYLYTFIPAIIVLLIFSPYLFGKLQNFFMDLGKDSRIHQFGIFIWLNNAPVFYVLSIVIIRNYLKKNKDIVQNINVNLFFYFNSAFAIYLIFQLSRPVIYNMFGISVPFNSYVVIWFVEMGYIIGLGYLGLKKV